MKKRQSKIEKVKKNKKKRIKYLIKNVSFKNLNTEIKSYGYNYNLKNYVIQMFVFLIAVVTAGYIYLLKPICIMILIICAVVMFPIIVRAQFKHMHNNQRFENLVNYMQKMIIFFKQNPKIVKSVEKTRKYVDDVTGKKLDETLHILNYDTGDNRYAKALKVIEDEYHSSRVVTLHRFMINIEEKGSKTYRTSLNNLDYDLKEWINRVYDYQRDLKTKKAQVMVSLIASILLLSIFSVMWTEIDHIAHVTTNPIYQIVATSFLLLVLLLFTLVQTKVNGQWLVEDYSDVEDKKIKRKIQKLHTYNYLNELKKQIPKLILFGLLAFYCMFVGQVPFGIFLLLIVGYLIYEPKQQQKTRIKSVGRIISTEFPLWLRDVSINLNNFVVVKAINNSKTFASELLMPYLNTLIVEIEEQPTSIEPFTNFLKEYKLNEITTSMLALYSLQEVSIEETEMEVTDIIQRNQVMLANAEKIRNQNALIGVLIISFVPIFFTMMKIMVDMVIMLLGIFSNMMV